MWGRVRKGKSGEYVIHIPIKKLNFLLSLSMVTATFLMTSPLCCLLKPDTQPHDESMQRYVPFIFAVSTTRLDNPGIESDSSQEPMCHLL
jgi:hypothetical protein